MGGSYSTPRPKPVLASKPAIQKKTLLSNGTKVCLPTQARTSVEKQIQSTFREKPVLASKLAIQKKTQLSNGTKVRLSTQARMSVEKQIRSTFREIAITDVFEVKNTFLEGMYLLKKEEYKVFKRQKNIRFPVVEKQLFHVTSAANVDSILRDNFDWRRVKRGRFGLGTSFSDNVKYANKYANNNGNQDRAVVVCDVLVNKIYEVGYGSSWNMKVPPKSADTAMGNGGRVLVKFNDNEFLPRYVVYFKALKDHRSSLSDDFSLLRL